MPIGGVRWPLVHQVTHDIIVGVALLVLELVLA